MKWFFNLSEGWRVAWAFLASLIFMIMFVVGAHIWADYSLTKDFKAGKIMKCHNYKYSNGDIVFVSLKRGYRAEEGKFFGNVYEFDISQDCKLKLIQE